VAFGDVDGELPAALVDGDDRRGGIVAAAAQPGAHGRQALQRAHAGVAAFVELRAPGELDEQVGDRRLPALDAGGQELRGQDVAVAVDHQSRQAVGLAVHQAHAVAGHGQALAQGQRGGQPALEERGIDALRLLPAPGAHADQRLGAVRAPGQERAVARLDAHRLAGIGLALVDAALEHPRVAAGQRALLAGAKLDDFHGADCPRRRPPLPRALRARAP